MKKAAESKEKTKEKKARLATPCLGNFGFKIQKNTRMMVKRTQEK